jgi:hypothetical protein
MMSKMTDAPENGLRRLTAAKAVEPADGIPAAANVAPPLRNDLRSAAYLSVLSGLTFQASRLMRGHTHSSVDCRVGWTLLLCDSHPCRDENPDFNAPCS